MFYFFFFQAEDGIRDRDVTGVQTCALPILLDGLDEIPVCVGYKIKGKKTTEIPALATGFEEVECIDDKIPGWKKPTLRLTEFEELRQKARDYLQLIESETAARLGMVPIGPHR